MSNTASNHDKVLESPFAEVNPHSQVVTYVIDKATASKYFDDVIANHMLQCSDTIFVPSPPRKSSPMKQQSLAVGKALVSNSSMLALQNPFSSLPGLEKEGVTDDLITGKPTIPIQIIDLHHNEQITTEN